MSKSVLQDLYRGRINAWERQSIHTAENIAVNRRIEDEKRYFIQKMSLDDVQRFEALENLYFQSSDFEQEDSFTYGFKLGAMLMCAVFMDDNRLTHD